MDQRAANQAHIPNFTINTGSARWNYSKQENIFNILSIYYLLLLSSRASHVVRRMTYDKLMENYSVLMTAYIEATKRPCIEDRAPLSDPSTALTLHAPNTDKGDLCLNMLPLYLRSDYPDIHYWYRNEWLKFKNKGKDSSDLGSKAGS